MDSLIGYLNIFPLKIGGVRRVGTYAMGSGLVASVHVRMMGGGGSIFAHLVHRC